MKLNLNLNLDKFDKIMSLGATCTFSVLYSLNNFHRCLFDVSMVTSMWAICQLLENNFDNFFCDMAYEKLYDGINGCAVYDKKYGIRIHGSNPTSPSCLSFCESTKQQGMEFMNTLKNLTGNVLFLRHAEVPHHKYYGKRLNNPDFAMYYEKPELDYVKKFSNIIKNINPNVNFKILYISDVNECFIDSEHNIIGIPDNPLAEFLNKDLHYIMTSHLNEYSSFISENI